MCVKMNKVEQEAVRVCMMSRSTIGGNDEKSDLEFSVLRSTCTLRKQTLYCWA